MLRAAFQFFEEHPDFVRLARREALDGGPILAEELGAALRPLFEKGCAWLESEMDAGRLRRYDPAQLLLTGYGAVLSYLSDAALITALLDADHFTGDALALRREHVLAVLRAALEPLRARRALRRSRASRHVSSRAASPNTSTMFHRTAAL